MSYHRSVRTLGLAIALLLSPGVACDDDGSGPGQTPETSCCELDEQPGQGGSLPCIEGVSCCADGTWSCNEGDGSPTCDSAGGVCTSAEEELE